MANAAELYEQTQAWVGGREHFKNPVAAAFERGPFAQQVVGYVHLLQVANESLTPSGLIKVPLKTTEVESADFHLLQQLISGLKQDFSNQAELSLAVSAETVEDNAYLALVVRRNEEEYCYVMVVEKEGKVGLEVIQTEESKDNTTVQRAMQRLGTEIYTGAPWVKEQRGMQAADKVFKFIVSQTLPQIQETYQDEIQEALE